MCSSRGQCPLNCYCPMLPLQCLGEYQRHFLIRPPDIVQWHHYHRLRHFYFFQWLCFHWCYMYFSRLPHYFHGQITAALISRKTQHCASFDFALSFKILHCSDVKAIAHFCSLFPSFLTMSLHKSSFSQVFPTGKSGATFLTMSTVLATCLAFFRFARFRIFCFLFLDFLFIAEKECLNGGVEQELRTFLE